MLLFVVINGHLLILMAVVKSFDRFPVDGNFLQALGQMRFMNWAHPCFPARSGSLMPMIALLLFVNLTMGIISRVAPQMNIYAVGFPRHAHGGDAGHRGNTADAGATGDWRSCSRRSICLLLNGSQGLGTLRPAGCGWRRP